MYVANTFMLALLWFLLFSEFNVWVHLHYEAYLMHKQVPST